MPRAPERREKGNLKNKAPRLRLRTPELRCLLARALTDIIEQNVDPAIRLTRPSERLSYRSVGGGSNREAALLWVLNLSDGENDLVAISDRSTIPFAVVSEAADALVAAELLRPL